jgi:hypothetical protein
MNMSTCCLGDISTSAGKSEAAAGTPRIQKPFPGTAHTVAGENMPTEEGDGREAQVRLESSSATAADAGFRAVLIAGSSWFPQFYKFNSDSWSKITRRNVNTCVIMELSVGNRKNQAT